MGGIPVWLLLVVGAVVLIAIAYWLWSSGKKPAEDSRESKDRKPKTSATKPERTPKSDEKKSSSSSEKQRPPKKSAADSPNEKKTKASSSKEKPAEKKKETVAEQPDRSEDKKKKDEALQDKSEAEDAEGPEAAKDGPKPEEVPVSSETTAQKDEEPREPEPDGDLHEESEPESTNDEPPSAESAAEDKEAKKPVLDDETLIAAKKARQKALRKGLKGTRGGFIAKLGNLLKGKKEVDPDLLEKIEEVLLTSDVGVQFTERLVNSMKENLSGKELTDPDMVWSFIREIAQTLLTPEGQPWDIEREKPFVIMVIGVNGVGKTTTIAKLASRYVKDGKKVVLAAGDTFRAAAVRQLEMWGQRVGAEVVKNDKQGADPSSVVFDAVKKGVEDGADVVIADTAGRLHTKAPLMEELKKVGRVMGKALETAPHEVLIVLDANTGQNAIQQVRDFGEALGITGIVLTKLDGTAKGGVILGICEEHKIPVRFIGVGERDDDLREFDAEDFVSVLFERPEDAEESAA